MRFFDYTFDKASKDKIQELIVQNNEQFKLIEEDYLYDILAPVFSNKTAREMSLPFRDIYSKAIHESSIRNIGVNIYINRVFSIQRDLYCFFSSYFYQNILKSSLSNFEKSEIILNLLAQVLKAKTDLQPNSLSRKTTKKAAADSWAAQNANTASIDLSSLTNFLSEFIDEDDENEEDEVEDENVKSNGFSKGKGKIPKKFTKENLGLIKKQIETALRLFNSNRKIFELAEKFSELFTKKDFGEYKEAKIGTSIKIRKLRNLSDFKFVKKGEFSLPDEVFDVKLMKKSLIVEQPIERSERLMKPYILVDKSASMIGERFTFAKAFLVAFAAHCRRNKTPVLFKFFADSPTKTYIQKPSSSWLDFIEQVVESVAYGGTDIIKALSAAADEVSGNPNYSDYDIILITDATERLIPEAIKSLLRGVKVDTILISSDSNDEILACYKVFSDKIVKCGDSFAELDAGVSDFISFL